MMQQYRLKLLLIFFGFLVSICTTDIANAQPGSANVLFADHPLPIRVGIEVGATYTNFLNGTPTFFPTQYPYNSAGPDTLHSQFPNGAKAGIGLHLGIAADFALSTTWGLLTKLNYNERRATWNATTNAQAFDSATALPITVPLTNNLNLVLRYVTLEIMASWSIKSLDWFYLAGGFAISDMTSNNYALTETLGGPSSISFLDRGTGQGTGIKQFSLTNSFNGTFNSILGEVKLLAGFPIRIGHRWTLNPEVTVAYPFTQLFNSTTRAVYQQEGFANTPNPMTIAGILALRYEL